MAGIRVGTLYTESRDLVEAVAKLGAFHGLPGTTQKQVAQLLQDRGMKRLTLSPYSIIWKIEIHIIII